MALEVCEVYVSKEQILADVEKKMAHVIDGFKKELSKQRTGRAQPSLVATLLVESYGQKMPLEQLASITSEGPTTLAIKPWDKSTTPAIEKAILRSGLGFNPATSGDITRISMPPLTEERRREIVKVIKNYQENAKIGCRSQRRDAMAALKLLEKDGLLSEDEIKRAQDEVQKVTDSCVKTIDNITSEKESDIMKV